MFRDGAERLLVFRLGGERFAVRLADVDEVVDAPPVQALPDAPPGVLGLATLRGELVAVYDSAFLLHVAADSRGALLLFARDGRRIGLAIDDVYDAIMVEGAEVRSAPGTEAADGMLVGVVRRGTELVSVLDASALLGAALAAAEGERA